MGEDSSPRCLVTSDSTFLRWETSQRATRRLSRIWGKDSSPRCPVSPLAPHRARLCAPLFGLVRRLPPAAVQRGRAQLALCVPGSPVQIGALSVSLAAWSPLRRHLVQRKGFSAWGGSLLRRVRLPHPSGESFDLRKLRPNDSPPVASAAGLRRSQGGLAACRLGPRLPPENHSTCAGSGRMILLRSFLRPGLRGLAKFRSALRAPVICSPSSCVGQESRLLKPACRSAQTPSGVFLFFRSLRSRKSTGRCASSCAPAFSCSLRSIVLLN